MRGADRGQDVSFGAGVTLVGFAVADPLLVHGLKHTKQAKSQSVRSSDEETSEGNVTSFGFMMMIVGASFCNAVGTVDIG